MEWKRLVSVYPFYLGYTVFVFSIKGTRTIKCNSPVDCCHPAFPPDAPFPFLSFRPFRFTLSLPFPELPLAFCAFVVGENVRKDAPGDVFNLVLRNTGIVDALLLAAQAGCSLRFNMIFFRCSCGWRTICTGGTAPF